MFSRGYRLKGSVALKNSDKKQLAQRIQQEFHSSDEKTKELIPNKSTANCLKLVTYGGDTVTVYAIDNIPIMIEAFDKLYPTVCALWKIPDLVPTITIHSPIVSKLKTGVPLYVPGVVIPEQGRGFPLFQLGVTIAVNSEDNRAQAAVGKALMSSAGLLLNTSGVCLESIHVLGDFLCKEPKFGKIERPQFGPATYSTADNESLVGNLNLLSLNPAPAPLPKEEWPSLGGFSRHTQTSQVVNTPREANSTSQAVVNTPQEADNSSQEDNEMTQEDLEDDNGTDDTMDEQFPEDMDGLLKFCLLSFLKLEGKKVELPLRTNLLYRNYMVPLCPPNKALDVKKSSYKKMGKFMDAMQQVREIEKGVDALTGMDPAHPAVRAHLVPEDVRARGAAAGQVQRDPDAYAPPIVREMYCVTANVLDVFAPLRKGTALTAPEVRSTLTEYVRRNNLQTAERKGHVRMDAALEKIVGKAGLVSWEELMSSTQHKMTACTEMQFSDGTVKINKSKLQPIKMQVATRSGNKKVTIVSNLEQFGFSLPALSKVCQHGLSVASSVTRTPGSKDDQLLVQGDQTYFVTKLLVDKYSIPKKFIEGADKALKKKK